MKNRLKRFQSVIIVVVIFINLTNIGLYAEEDLDYYDYAEKLAQLNVFRGTGNGFELEREPTRLEGLIMLIRLLGKEDESKTMENDVCLFNDVPTWGIGYVNYAYENGLTNGIGNNLFGSTDNIDAKSYMTFILRALGYDDKIGDFSWKEANEFAYEHNILDDILLEEIQDKSFLRQHIAVITYKALGCNLKNNDLFLIEKLIVDEAVSETVAANIGFNDIIEPKITTLKISSNIINIFPGKEFQLQCQLTGYGDYDDTVVWKTDALISGITVNDHGKVIVNSNAKAGQYTITATAATSLGPVPSTKIEQSIFVLIC